MKTRATSNHATIPAYGYVRMSTDQQDKSPAQQRDQVKKLAAAKGYDVLQWFSDEGITGDSIEQRPEFARMLKLAAGSGAKVILLWDLSRFGRFDVFDAGIVVSPLRKAGVRLVTVADGEINWDDFAGQMMFMMQAGGNNKFLKDLSRNVARGKWSGREGGSFITRTPPGVVRIFFLPSGQEVARAEWDQQLQRAKGWCCRIGISEDPKRAHEKEAMLWAFHEYAYSGASLHAISRGIEQRGIVAAGSGGRIEPATVARWLSNPKYVGRVQLGRFPAGKYHRLGSEGEILPMGAAHDGRRPRGRRGAVPIAEMATRFPALIPERTFDAVQQRLLANFRVGRPGTVGILSGIVRCGACGGRAWATLAKVGGIERLYYSCGADGDGTAGGCFCVRGEPIEDYAIRLVGELVESTSAPEKIKEAIERRNEDSPRPRRDVAARRLALLDSQLATARRNMLLAGPEHFEALQAITDGIQRERDRCQAEKSRDPRKDVKKQVVRAAEAAATVREALAGGDRMLVRRLMQNVFRSITVRFRPIAGRVAAFEGGVAELRIGGGPLSALDVADYLETLKREPLLRTAQLVEIA